MSIRELLLNSEMSLTPSEERIVQVLLTDYPTAGLGSATSLAKRAGVSDPTVVRLAVKLGFEGFPAFQQKLLAEVEARLQSPLHMMEAKRRHLEALGAAGPANGYLHSVAGCMTRALTSVPAGTYERAARLILETKGQVALVGGRFSQHIAGMLAGYLAQLRSGIRPVGVLSPQQFDMLIDLGKRDLLIVFDYRRYQLNVIAFAEQAAARGVRVLLFTDPWLSPICHHAELTLVSPVEVDSPYDTMAPAVAQMEALIAQMLADMDEQTRNRIEELEQIRLQASITLDNARSVAKDAPSPDAQKRGASTPTSRRNKAET